MPNFYNPYYPMQNNVYQPPQQQQMPLPQPQIQNGGFVNVRSEDEAKNYPVALGNSVTFKDETSPYIYTKTMGFSQLDRPIFEKYKLVKEMPAEGSNLTEKAADDDNSIKSTIEEMKAEIKRIWGEIEGIKKQEDDGV
jgi:hypothetical protein